MNYYEPKHFIAKEVFSPNIVKDHTTAQGKILNTIWRLFDWRILWTADRLRERFGVVYANDYVWGGKYKYRGFRPIVELINWNCHRNFEKIKPIAPYSFTSQHCFCRALDLKFKRMEVSEVIEDIKINSHLNMYKYISAIELGVTWLHIDCRSRGTFYSDDIFYFGS